MGSTAGSRGPGVWSPACRVRGGRQSASNGHRHLFYSRPVLCVAVGLVVDRRVRVTIWLLFAE